MSLEIVVCCQVDVFATVRSLVQGIPIDCGVCECDLGTSSTGRPWSTTAVRP